MSEDKQGAWQLIMGGGGVAAVIIALILGVSKDASIALSVAEQHGQELLEIRAELTSLRSHIADRTRSRYTAEDAAKDMRFVQQELQHIEENIKQLHDKR